MQKSKYELTVVLPEKDEEVQKQVVTLIEDFVKTSKGKITKRESWGVKELAYPIKKHKKGLYEFFVLELESQQQPKLADKLRLQEGLLRYLFVRV